MPIFANSRALL